MTNQLWKSSLMVVGTGQTIDKSVVEIVSDGCMEGKTTDKSVVEIVTGGSREGTDYR